MRLHPHRDSSLGKIEMVNEGIPIKQRLYSSGPKFTYTYHTFHCISSFLMISASVIFGHQTSFDQTFYFSPQPPVDNGSKITSYLLEWDEVNGQS